jgi:hypothetical protein
MSSLIELHVRYCGAEWFLQLVRHEGVWVAGLMVPGKEDLAGGFAPYAPRGAVLPVADHDDMKLKVKAPEGRVLNLATLKIISAGGVAVRCGWIEVPLAGLMRSYEDSKGDRVPEPNRAQILKFPKEKARARDGGIER